MHNNTHIIIKYNNKEYTIYKKSGVVYDNTTAKDIPPMIFKLRDVYTSRKVVK